MTARSKLRRQNGMPPESFCKFAALSRVRGNVGPGVQGQLERRMGGTLALLVEGWVKFGPASARLHQKTLTRGQLFESNN